MVFRTLGPDPKINVEVQQQVGKVSKVSSDPCRLTILWFLTKDPRGLGLFFLAKANTYVDMLQAPAPA